MLVLFLSLWLVGCRCFPDKKRATRFHQLPESEEARQAGGRGGAQKGAVEVRVDTPGAAPGGRAPFSSGVSGIAAGGAAGLGGGLGTGGSNSSTSSSASVLAGVDRPGPSGSLTLKDKPVLRAEDFEAAWTSAATCELWGVALKDIPSESDLERSLARHHCVCLASGNLGDVQKYYFFAQERGTDALFMVELSITMASKRLSAMVKGPSEQQGMVFSHMVKDCLSRLGA